MVLITPAERETMMEPHPHPSDAQSPRLSPSLPDGTPTFIVSPQDGIILNANAAAERLGLAGGAAPAALRTLARTFDPEALPMGLMVRLRPPLSLQTLTFRCSSAARGTFRLTAVAPAAKGPAARSEPRAALAADAPLRFTFESDARGRFLQLSEGLSSVLGGIAPRLLGASLAELEEDGLVTGAGVAHAALTAGQAFSGLRLTLAGERPFDLELGGIPLLGTDRAPLGMRGFGVARPLPRLRVREQAPDPSPSPPRLSADSKVVALRGAPRLTATEHSAFQEIARTLSAAVEDWPTVAPAPEHPADQVAASVAPAVEPAAPELLDRLPVAILIQQDGEVVHANATFHHWTGYKDLPTFARAGGLSGALERDRDGRLQLLTASSVCLPVDVRLLAAPFRGRNALVYVVRRLDGPDAAQADDLRQKDRAQGRREALDLMPWPVLLMDEDGLVIFANAAATHLLERSEGALLGEPFTVLVAPQHRADAETALAQALTTDPGTGIAQSLRVCLRSGSEATVNAAFARGGIQDRLVCLVLAPPSNDGPAASAAEEEAEASVPPTNAPEPALAEPDLPRLARLLRERMSGPLDLLLASDGLADAASAPIRTALSRVRADLDDLSALATSEPVLERRTCDLVPLISDVLAPMTPAARRRGVRLRADMPTAAPQLVSSEPRLARLVRLILEEAVDASPAGACVTLSLSGEAGAHVLCVADAGAAMDEVAQAQAADPLTHGVQAASRIEPGSERDTGALRFARLAQEARHLGGALTVRRGLSQGLVAILRLPDTV